MARVGRCCGDIRMGRVGVSGTSLVFAGVALASALAVYALYSLAEAALRARRVSRRDWVMLPGLAVVVTVIGLGLEWLDRHRPELVGGVGFAAFLGLNLGRLVWRARDAGRLRRR
jgi:cyanate permease